MIFSLLDILSSEKYASHPRGTIVRYSLFLVDKDFYLTLGVGFEIVGVEGILAFKAIFACLTGVANAVASFSCSRISLFLY